MHDVLLVDDHPFFLHGLEQYLLATGKFRVRSAQSVDEAIMILSEYRPDIALLDVSMADGGGMRVLRHLRELGGIPAMFLTVHIDPEDTINAMRLGIRGIALKDSDPDEILRSVNTILSGGTDFNTEVTEQALRFSVESPTPRTRADELLTAREQTIVDYVCMGMRNRDIAERCNLTEGTVKAHLHSVFRKLGVSSRAELIVSQGGLRVAEK